MHQVSGFMGLVAVVNVVQSMRLNLHFGLWSESCDIDISWNQADKHNIEVGLFEFSVCRIKIEISRVKL